MRSTKLNLPLITFALLFAVLSAAECFGQSAKDPNDNADRRKRVVASGRLTGTRELQQIVSWQTRNTAHLAIESRPPRSRVLWQTDSRSGESRVGSVRISDLDGDGIPEIISLWWSRSSQGAALRVVHWDHGQNSFVEVQSESQIDRVHTYRIVPAAGTRSASRIVIDRRFESGARNPALQYELRGSKLTLVGGGRIVTTQGESGIEGQAVISPARPGPIRQGMSGSAPYKTTLVVWRTDGDREVARVETGSDGRFRVALPPGAYRVGAPPQAGRFLPRASEETVTVLPGKYARVTISFDSGMR